MPTNSAPAPVLTIDGQHPAEYALGWGDGSSVDGCRFYNCGHMVGSSSRMVANPDWSPEDWRELARAARELARDLGMTGEDRKHRRELFQLARWADARTHGSQLFEYFDGETGRPIVRMPESVVYGCSGSGSQDANVSAAMPHVEWLADADDIRASLKRWGAWGADDLADDDANRERMLWLAACNIAEDDPAMYAV